MNRIVLDEEKEKQQRKKIQRLRIYIQVESKPTPYMSRMGHMHMFNVYILRHNTAETHIPHTDTHSHCSSFGHFLSNKNKLWTIANFFKFRPQERKNYILGRHSEKLKVKFTIYLNWPNIFTHLKINTIQITHAKSALISTASPSPIHALELLILWRGEKQTFDANKSSKPKS